MSSTTREPRWVMVPIVGLLALGPATGPDYERIGADAEPLRTAFDADPGKARILMLVAPT